MGGRMVKFLTAGAILGTGLYITDQLWFGMVHPRLPDNFTNWVSMNKGRADAYRYGVAALGGIVIVPLAARLVGLGAKSPIRADASPLKA